jgi:hypothetical protein
MALEAGAFSPASGGRFMPPEPDDVPDASSTARSHRRAKHRRGWVLAGAAAIAALAFVLWWFEPQALLFDDVVDDSFPVGSADQDDDVPVAPTDGAGTDSADPDPADEEPPAGGDGTEPEEVEPDPSGPVELATGPFVSRNRYTVTGTATAYQFEDGQRLLRLEDFESTNGPDLLVYLTVAGASDDDAALAADFVDLGALRGNIGNQNYVIPPDVDLDRYDSVVIWCRRFTTSFGVADLTP